MKIPGARSRPSDRGAVPLSAPIVLGDIHSTTTVLRTSSPLLRALEMLSRGYNAGASLFSAVILAVITVLVLVQVVSRYALGHPLSWSEEVASFAFAWLIFIGGTVGVREGDAPALRVLVQRLPARLGAAADLLGGILAAALSLYLVWYGVKASVELMGQMTPATQIPTGAVVLVIPIAGLGFFLHFVNRLSQTFLKSARECVKAAVMVVVVGVAFWLAPISGLPANLVLFLGLVLGFALGMPVAFVLIFASLMTVLSSNDGPLTIVPEQLLQGGSNFILLAVPLFMLTGAIMQNGKMAQKLISFASVLVARFRGGLLLVDVFASALFADISGSAVSDTAAIGSVMLPGMIKRGYNREFSTAVQAASGTLGVLFPPSIATIIYAYVANVSVSEMFLASFLPAFLVVLSFCIIIAITAQRNDYPREQAVPLPEVGKTFLTSLGALLAPVIIIGSILTGVVTPAEAGVIAVTYTILCSALVYRDLRLSTIISSLREGATGGARVMLILSAAILLSYTLTIQQIPQLLSAWLLSFSQNALVLFLLLNLLLILIHGVLETSSTIILMVPLVMPAFVAAGVDPIHLGIIFLVSSAVGLLTPPIGFLLYIAAPIGGITVERLIKAVIPFWLALLVDLVLLVVFPQISSILPHIVHSLT